MSVMIQYDFFEKNDELSVLKREVEQNYQELQRVRKGSFAEISNNKKSVNELLNMVLSLQEDIAKIRHELIKIKN